MSQAAVVEELVNKVSGSPGVIGVVIVNGDGIPVRSTLNDRAADLQYAALVSDLVLKAKAAVRVLDAEDVVQTIRLHSVHHEIIIAPEKDVVMVVIQAPAKH
jgi:dynein light chain roadblock-type